MDSQGSAGAEGGSHGSRKRKTAGSLNRVLPQKDALPPQKGYRLSSAHTKCPGKADLQMNNKSFLVYLCPKYCMGHMYAKKNTCESEIQIRLDVLYFI